MHKALSILTVVITALFALPFAVFGGYIIGFIIGAEMNNKGDMGTGLAAILIFLFVLPICITACILSIFLIRKVLKDLYDNIKINLVTKYLIIGLLVVAGIGILYPVINDSMWQY